MPKIIQSVYILHGYAYLILLWNLKTFISSDEDECAFGLHDCDLVLGECVNIEGGYICQCIYGYEGDGKVGGCHGM